MKPTKCVRDQFVHVRAHMHVRGDVFGLHVNFHAWVWALFF